MSDVARFERLRDRLGALHGRSPALARQIGDVDISSLRAPADLAAIPVLRKSALADMQRAAPPFGALAAAPTDAFLRLFASPGGIYEPEQAGADPWGAARAFAAAGVARGDIVVNCFSYHLTPGGRILESGAMALGCPVIPAGPGNTEQLIAAIAHLRPSVYAGPPDFLKIVLDKARTLRADVSSLTKALVSSAALPPTLRAELEGAGIRTRQAYATADLGAIAWETDDTNGNLMPGLAVNDDLIVEIVTPGTDDPAPAGKVGEVVATRLVGDYSLLRFATGDLSQWAAPGRLRGWMGRADQSTKVRGLFVHPGQVVEAGKRHAGLGAVRLVVTRTGEQDAMTLHAETPAASDALAAAVAATLQALTKLRGEVRLVAPGALPNDGKIISDERPVE
ncbi:phenylacetate-CoA ligase [Roseiarcus fermentans]|uniref:Phenylacetate-CoA ligase n=1 Tax=Roseiarcus fermentans TaxID=1473586 RepID=A0A366FNQ5_9HYPH|nr:AMP-binding protein [Roseiarcus fermentans]RBP16197.1 phenylacetate-CoA ligase [Roseiarcus fermentans]